MLAKAITEDKPTTNEIQNAQNNEINEIVMASDAAEIATTSRNQETETVAMANDLMNVTPTNLSPITTKTNTTAENVTETVTETTPTHNTTLTTKTNATTLTSNDASQTPSIATGKCLVTPTSASGSLKKKKRNKNAHAKQSTSGTFDTEAISGADMTITGANTMPTSIKTSWSMSSLPYDEKQEIRDVIEAKLRVERPYNSLKKTTERRIIESNVCHTLPSRKNHRYSWGSGFSHSSSSLHSSAATLGIGSGKDDLWAVIQTNYNYIMDTNLLDTCKEARYEIEGEPTVQAVDFCYKILDETNRNESFCEDPRDLRKWLREMEQKLSNAPSLTQAAHFSCAELQRQQAEYSVLYHEIVSHARVVSACIRAASEREQQQQYQQEQQQQQLQQLQQQQLFNSNLSSIGQQNNLSLSSTDETSTTASSSITTQTLSSIGSGCGSGSGSVSGSVGYYSSGIGSEATNSVSGCKSINTEGTKETAGAHLAVGATALAAPATKKSEGNLERLQNRYHLLYLKAFEVQLCLDGLLRKKSSSPSGLDDDIEDDEDDYSSELCVDVSGAATEDDLNDVASELESDDVVTNNSSSFCELVRCNIDSKHLSIAATSPIATAQPRECIKNKLDCEDGDDEQEEEDDEDEVDASNFQQVCRKLNYSSFSTTCDKSSNFGRNSTFNATTATLTDFDADSESSDYETFKNFNRRKFTDFHCNSNYVQQQQVKVSPHILPITKSTATELLTNNFGKHSSTQLVTINQNAPLATDTARATPITHCTNNVATALGMDNLCYQQQLKLPEAITNTNTTGETVATKETILTETFNALAMQTKMGLNVVDIQQQLQPQQQHQQQHRTTLLQTLNNMNIDTELQNQQQKLQTLPANSNNNPAMSAGKHKNVAIISPNNSHNNTGNNRIIGDANSNKSPKVLRKRQQQQHRHIDISKFNRSNRKSKNCAIFYFKHLDTDNETNYGLSSSASHTSDLLKSADASSDDDEGWLYTTAPPAVTATQPTIAAATATGNDLDCLDSTSANSTLNSSILVDGIQSSTVSSSTDDTIATNIAAAASTSATAAIISDDSDKENKEALAAIAAHNRIVVTSSSPSLLNSAQFSNTDFQLTTTSASSSAAYIGNNSIINSNCNNNNNNNNKNGSNNNSSGSSCNSSKISRSDCGSSCSSNDLLTETTTTTTTATTQITEMHCQHLKRKEMQLQINSGHNGNSNNNIEKSNHIIVAGNNNCNHVSNNKYCNKNNNQQCLDVKNLHQQQLSTTEDNNGNTQKDKLCFYTRADICNITVKPSDTMYIQQQQLLSPGKRLPPRSPAKSHKSKSGNNATMSTTKGKVSHESIKQLVLEAEHLVRDEALKTPTKQKHSAALKISTTVKKREVIMPGPIKQRVQEWLEHQPTTPPQMHNKTHDSLNGSNNLKGANRTDDCEASGEASETDSIPQQVSDSSEGFTDSIATCMQTSTNSYGNSTEHMGGSAEPIMMTTSNAVGHGCGSSNQSLNIVKTVNRRQNNTRRKSERPWSVSCLSQLTTATQVAKNVNNTNDLATHSISESALDSLSPRRPRVASTSAAHSRSTVKTYDSKGSLKRRKTRKKKISNSTTAAVAAAYSIGKKTDSGSEETTEIPKLTHTLLMKSCESMSAQQIQEITAALLNLQKNTASTSTELIGNVNATATKQQHQQQQQQQQHQQQQQLQQQQQQQNESEEEAQLMKPNFRVGSYTTAYMRSEARLGSLAALATYMNDEEQQGEYTTGTEDHHSSFSETAWDNYQEKYNSENYSEGFDSDAARRLLEFGDDYRNFIDSQSDCCSSLSAANNLDSLSPPRMDSLQQNEAKIITQDTIVSSVDHARRRRALELEYERRRKTLEVRRKSCQDSSDNQPRSPTISLSSSANALTPKNGEKFNYQQQRTDSINRKLDFGMSHSAQSLRRTSESDTSTRRRKVDERRRSSRNLEKSIKLIPATTSSSCDDSDDEKEMRNLLGQSRNRLEDTRALKIRCHLLRPEDYDEIINTCRDNIRCLESVLRGPPGTVLSTHCVSQTKDLLGAWEELLMWSENAAAARKMQEEMIILKHALNRLGNKSSFELIDTEPAIQIAIESLKNEKSQLQNYRISMLRLNASVHSWLTRQERKLQAALIDQELKEASVKVAAENKVLLEEKEEAESEQMEAALRQEMGQDEATPLASPDTTTMRITVTDSNGNQLETLSTTSNASQSTVATSTVAIATTTSNLDKQWDLHSLMNSENEFYKHLKDEVADMYRAWDEASDRVNSMIGELEESIIAWRLLETGLMEFHAVLGQDRGTLKGLEGALDNGQTTPVELAQNVKLVAKLLSENVHVSPEQLTAVHEHLDPNHMLHIAKFTASNGSLSDSGISDGGATSDGGLSERERRLSALRRLAKKLESSLAPGSNAVKSIAARMESAEADLKNLQNTCRDLIVRTATSHQNMKQQQQQAQQLEAQQQKNTKPNNETAVQQQQQYTNTQSHKCNGHLPNGKQNAQQQNSTSKRKNKRKQRPPNGEENAANKGGTTNKKAAEHKNKALALTAAPDSGDPSDDDPALEFDMDSSDDEHNKTPKNSWARRIARAAVPVQLALFTVFCAACLMQPNCCDNLNNFSMSFAPQLRYIRGPPPI